MNNKIQHKCIKCNKILSTKQSLKNHEGICKEKPKEEVINEEKPKETNMTRIKEKLKVYSEEKQSKILELKIKIQDYIDIDSIDQTLINDLKQELIDNDKLYNEIFNDIYLRIDMRSCGIGFAFEEERIKKKNNIYYDVIRATENLELLFEYIKYEKILSKYTYAVKTVIKHKCFINSKYKCQFKPYFIYSFIKNRIENSKNHKYLKKKKQIFF